MTIEGSFILEHPYVKAVFGRKKWTPLNGRPELCTAISCRSGPWTRA